MTEMSNSSFLIVHKDHGMDIRGPNSGAETATRFLARALVQLGQKVIVAAQIIGTEEVIDGVEYWDLGPAFDSLAALSRMAALGEYHLISSGRAQPLLESRRDPMCLSRILISHDRSGNDTGIKPEVLCRVVDYVVCVSDAQRDVFLKAGADPQKVVTLFNGVDFDIFSIGTPEARNYRKLVFVGALVEDKGIHWLIESYCKLKAKYPDLTLDVYGSSGLWGRKRIFDEEDIQRRVPGITFHGKVTQEVVAKAYREAGLCVIPSIWFDPFPLTALEAQACGCPVLTFDVGGLKEGVLDERTAVVMKDINPDVLTANLDQLISDPERLKLYAATAIKDCRPRFTWPKVAGGIIELAQKGAAQRQPEGAARDIRKGRFGVLSTWNQSCGLATYARFLFSNFDPDSFVVLGEEAEGIFDSDAQDSPLVERCWKRGRDDFSAIERVVQRYDLKLLHLNCQPGFFSQPSFGKFLGTLRARGITVVAHLHNTFTLESAAENLIASVDRVIVHSPENRLEAIANGAAPQCVSVLPHGVHALPVRTQDERTALRAKLSIPHDSTAVTAFGFIQPHKGMEGIIESVAHLVSRGVNARGYVVGEVMPQDPNSIPYLELLRRHATDKGVADRVTILNRFVSDQEVGEYLQASDLVLMNYRSQHFEASGACSLAVGAGAVVLTSLAPPFAPFKDAVWHLSAGYPVPLSVELLLARPALKEELQKKAQAYSEKFSWKNIAQSIRAYYLELGFEPVVIRREKVVAMAPTNYTTTSSLKVLVQNRPNAWTQAGGDTVVMEKTILGLKAKGVQVTVDLEGRLDPKGYDVVHLFNFALPELLKQQAERCVTAGVPFVVTTLCEDVPSFHNQSWEAARILFEYVSQGKSAEWIKERWKDLAKVTPSARFQNDWVAERAHALLANGRGEKKLLERDYPKSRLVCEVPLGFEVGAAADPQLFTREYGISDFILCVGRIESRKNQLMLLKAMEDSELPIVLAGGGFSYQPDYEQAVRSFRRKGKTIVVGRLTPQLLASAYAACRVHALPSWYELPGLVSLEAASFGKNVVVTETGTTPDYFAEHAFYADPSNWRSISNAVRAAYYSPVVPGLQAHVRAFTWDACVEKTLQVYEQVVSAAGRRTQAAAPLAAPSAQPCAPSWFTPGVVAVSPAVVAAPAAQFMAPPVTSSAAPSWGSLPQPAVSAATPASVTATVSAALSTPQAPAFDSVLSAGEEAAKKGEFAEAHRLLAQAESLNPTSARCLRARGAVFLAEQQRAEARGYFKRALTLDSREARALIGLGMCAAFEGNNLEGHDLFAAALEIDPEQATALHQLIQSAHSLGRFDVLEKALRRYLAKQPGDFEFQFCLAGCLFKQGNIVEAKTWANKVISAQQSHRGASELLPILEKALAAAAQPAIAPSTTVATSAQVIPSEPSWLTASKVNSVAMTVRSSESKQQPAESSTVATAAAKPPAYSPIEQELDVLEDQKRQQKFEEVAKGCDGILGRPALSAKERERAELIRAETHTMFEEFDKAVERYDRVLSANPRCARAVCGKGAIAAHQNDWVKAEQFFQHALSFSPEFDIACAGLGICAAQQRNTEKAWEWYLRATKANPENLRAIYGLIELSYPLKRLSELEQALRAYLEMHPADLQFVYSLAGCLYAQNKVPEAKAEVEKIIVFEPSNGKAIELQGLIQKKLEGGSGAGWRH